MVKHIALFKLKKRDSCEQGSAIQHTPTMLPLPVFLPA